MAVDEEIEMKHIFLMLAALVLATGQAFAGEAAFCAPAQEYIDVVETVNVQVPVTTYVDQPYQYQTTRMVPVQQQVQVPQGRWVTETRTVPCTRTVYETQAYTDYETRTIRRPVTRMRQVTRTITENETRTVCETVYDQVCDTCTGKMRKVPRQVNRTVVVPVKRKICVEEPYTDTVKERIRVPVQRTRQVAREVPSTRQVTERRWVTETACRTVTTMQPVQETAYGTRKVPVTTMRQEQRQIVRRIPAPAPAPCDTTCG